VSASAPAVACVGDNCVDVYVDAGGVERVGGNALNVALELARRGARASYLGAVGSDAHGRLVLAGARAGGVDVSRTLVAEGATGVTLVGHHANGERRFISEEYGVAAEYRVPARDEPVLQHARWVHAARQADLARWSPGVRAAGTPVSCDLNDFGPDALTSPVDVAFASAAEAAGEEEALALARDLLARGAELAVVTLGAAGSLAHSAGGTWRQPAIPVEVVDSLGAGDAFIAGVIAALLAGDDVGSALHAGACAGAEACARVGLAGDVPHAEVTT
jgi:fructoselysine 6-kinase